MCRFVGERTGAEDSEKLRLSARGRPSKGGEVISLVYFIQPIHFNPPYPSPHTPRIASATRTKGSWLRPKKLSRVSVRNSRLKNPKLHYSNVPNYSNRSIRNLQRQFKCKFDGSRTDRFAIELDIWCSHLDVLTSSLCFRGLALNQTDRKDEAEKVGFVILPIWIPSLTFQSYLHAFKLDPNHGLPEQALKKLYEKEQQWDKFGDLLERIVQAAFDR